MDSCPTFWHIGSWFPYSHCQPSLPSPSPPLQSTCPSVASMLPSATTSAPSSLPLPSVARSSMVPLHASSSPHPAPPPLSFSSLVRAPALLCLPCHAFLLALLGSSLLAPLVVAPVAHPQPHLCHRNAVPASVPHLTLCRRDSLSSCHPRRRFSWLRRNRHLA